MYESFYGFHKPPFSNIPDPDFLFLSSQHKQALSILQYALMARAGFCVITGNVGAGKTTLVRRVLQGLDQRIHVGLVSNTQCESFEELLRWILLAFELEYRGKDKVEMYDEFVQFLIRQFQSGNPVTLIIDEAQNLTPHQVKTIITRAGVGTKLVFTGDLDQIDRKRRLDRISNGLAYAAGRMANQEIVGHVDSPTHCCGCRKQPMKIACEGRTGNIVVHLDITSGTHWNRKPCPLHINISRRHWVRKHPHKV